MTRSHADFSADIIFGVFCFVMTIHIFFMYPETVGRSLEEIEFIFESNLPAWRSNEARHKFAEDVEAVKHRDSASGSVSGESIKGKDEEKEDRVEAV